MITINRILKIILFVWLITGINRVNAQTVQLVPDSCTFCLFLVSDGGTGWYQSGYGIYPNEDTVVLGNTYIRVNDILSPIQPFAIRQVGNQLFGVVADSVSEYLLMDFDAAIGDTIHQLYSEGFFYDAVVLNKDSVGVNNGVFHHFIALRGIGYYTQSGFSDSSWDFVWNERALCAANGAELGGVLFNIPIYPFAISAVYAFPDFCTTDPVYNNPSIVSCNNCYPQTNSLDELSSGKLTVSPNPVTDELSVLLENAVIEKLVIYNAYGLKVREQWIHSNQTTIRLHELPEGFYFLKLETDKGELASGFVKI